MSEQSFILRILDNIDNPETRKKVYEEFSKIALISDEYDFYELIEGLLKYPDSIEPIKSKWKIIFNNLEDSLEVFKKLCEYPEFAQEFVTNVPYLIDYSNIDNIGELAVQLATLENGSDAIIDNFEDLANCAYSHMDVIFSTALKSEKGRKLAKEHFELIKEDAQIGEFLNFINQLEGIDEFKDEYDQYSFWAKLYSDIMKISLRDAGLAYDQESEILYSQNRDLNFYNLMNSPDSEEKKLILQTVSNGHDFSFVSVGSTSLVMKVDDKIIKCGISKNQFAVPYHPRIMMPYFRKKYEDRSFLEIYNFGDVKNTRITDEELLKIYKELESAGIRWGDARKDNVLVLLKDNDLPNYIASTDFNVLGFLEDVRFPTTHHTALKKGDFVICDLDYLYAIDDPNYQEGLQDNVITDYLASKNFQATDDIEK